MAKEKSEKPKAAVPHNIQEFNAITGAIFALLYESHPQPKTITVEDVATALGRTRDEKMPSGRTFNEMFAHTLQWLAVNDFLSDMAGIAPHRCTLTVRALATLGMPTSLGGATRGSQIADAARTTGAFDKLADLAGGFMGSFAGSYTKSISGP